MFHIQNDGATKNAFPFEHPNGTLYQARAEARRLGGKPDRIIIEQWDGQRFVVRKEWIKGAPPFTGHGDVGGFTIRHDGTAYVLFLFNQIDDDRVEKAQPFGEFVPGFAPPYAEGQHYTIIDAIDEVARTEARGAQQAGQRAEQRALQLREWATGELEETGQQIRADLRKIGDEVRAYARTLVVGAIDTLLARLWGSPDHPDPTKRVAGTILDRLFKSLNTKTDPLPNVIRQQVDAALKVRGL